MAQSFDEQCIRLLNRLPQRLNQKFILRKFWWVCDGLEIWITHWEHLSSNQIIYTHFWYLQLDRLPSAVVTKVKSRLIIVDWNGVNLPYDSAGTHATFITCWEIMGFDWKVLYDPPCFPDYWLSPPGYWLITCFVKWTTLSEKYFWWFWWCESYHPKYF